MSADRTGWPPGLLQDDSADLSKWLAGKPDARMLARDAAAERIRQASAALGEGRPGCHLCDGCGWSSPWMPCICVTPATRDAEPKP